MFGWIKINGGIVKIRVGFVSNSSSASFVVRVKTTKKELYRILNEYFGWSYFSSRDLESIIKSNIGYDTKEVAEIKKDPKAWHLEPISMLRKKINTNEQFLKRLKTMKYEEIIPALLLEHRVMVSYDDKFKETVLDGWVTMFNDHGDIPEPLLAAMAALGSEKIPFKLIVNSES